MFDIAWSELLLIAVIALIFIGPKELPQVLHTLGRMTAKLRRSADDFQPLRQKTHFAIIA